MIQPISAKTINISATTTNYCGVMGEVVVGTADYIAGQVCPTSGVFDTFRVQLSDAPGAGKSRRISLFVNGVETDLSITISDTDVSGSDLTHTANVSAGDYIYYKAVPTGSPLISDCLMVMNFEGSIDGESILMAVNATSISATMYGAVIGDYETTVETAVNAVLPVGGICKKLYVKLQADPGAAPDAYTFTLRQNHVNTSLATTIVANDTTGNDTVHDVTVIAGDLINYSIVPISSPSIAPRAAVSMVFVSETAGESLILGGSSNNMNTAATYYRQLLSINTTASTTESDRNLLLNACTLRKLRVQLSDSPYVNSITLDTYAFTVRQNAANTALTTTIADEGTGNSLGVDDINNVTIIDGDLLSIKHTPSSSPLAVSSLFGMVAYIEEVGDSTSFEPVLEAIEFAPLSAAHMEMVLLQSITAMFGISYIVIEVSLPLLTFEGLSSSFLNIISLQPLAITEMSASETPNVNMTIEVELPCVAIELTSAHYINLIELPVVTIALSTGASLSHITLPFLSVSLSGLEAFNLNVKLPALTFSATASSYVQMITLPTLTFTGRGASLLNTVYLPFPTVEVQTANVLTVTLQGVEASFASTTGRCYLEVTLPYMRFAGTTFRDSHATIEVTLPMVTVVCDGSGNVHGNLTLQLPAVEFYSTMMMANSEVYAYVVSTKEGALTVYTNYTFNSFAEIGGRRFGGSDVGLIELTGVDDMGTAISASFQTGSYDAGVKNIKWCPNVVTILKSNGVVKIRPVMDGVAKAQKSITSTGSIFMAKNVLTDKGPVGMNVGVQVENYQGSSFEISSLEALLEMTNKVGK